MTKQTILVTGATGLQGGSVVEHLLNDGNFNIVALTRDPTKEAAKKLVEKGVKVVKGDLGDVDSLREAFKGVDGAFLVTQFWEKFSEDQEFKDGKNFIDVAKESKVKHIVFSTLEDVEKIAGYKVQHFDGKGKISQYAKEQNVPLTEIFVSFYAQNFLGMMPPKKNDNGVYVFAWGMKANKKMDIVDVSQLGKAVVSVLKDPKEWIGKSPIGFTGGAYSGDEIAEIFTKVTGKKSIFYSVSYEDQKKYSEDLANMFRFYEDFEGKLRSVETSKKLVHELRDLESFFRNNENWWKNL